MIKIKLSEIVTSQDVIGKLLNEKLSIKTLYKLHKILEAVLKEIKFFDERRIELVKKYGEVNSDNNVEVTNENLEAFYKELSELLDIEVDLQIPKFTNEELENVEMSYIEFNKIRHFIE